MKQLILILILLTCSIFGQSELLTLFDDGLLPNYSFFYADGEKFITSDNKKFVVQSDYLYTWVYPTFFSDDSTDLYFSYSQYGLMDWTNPLKVYDAPFQLRDPSIIQVQDTFFCVTTVNAFDNPCTSFAVLKSIDLNNWSLVTYVDISADIASTNKVWAPEWFVDGDSKYVIFSLSTINYQVWGGDDFQLYIISPNNNNMVEWSAPSKIDVTDETDIIDGFLYKENNIYYLFYIEHVSHKATYIEMATSNSLTGAFANIKSDDWMGIGYGEGVSIHKIKDKYIIFYDRYRQENGGLVSRAAYTTSDSLLTGWAEKLDLNYNLYHGTPFKINKNGEIIK